MKISKPEEAQCPAPLVAAGPSLVEPGAPRGSEADPGIRYHDGALCPARAVVGSTGRGLSTCLSTWPEAHQGGFVIKFWPHLMLNVITAVGLCGGDSILAEQQWF